MSIPDIGLARTLRWIAGAIAIIVAISLPLGYWLVVYSFAAEATAHDAETHAELVTQRINVNPDLWRFEVSRLDVIVATHPMIEGAAHKHTILDERGAVLVQNAEIPLSPPVLTRSAPLLDSGTVVGHFVTSRSLLSLLQHTALVAVFGLALAAAVFFSLSVLPLRALTRAQDALGQERERLRAIVDNAVEGIITFDLQGILRSANPAAERMFDYSSAEVVGRNAGDLLPEIDVTQAGLPGGLPYLGRLETLGRRKDGTRFPIELALSQALVDGRPQLIAIAHDITERKRVAQALHESETRFRSLTEMSSDFFWESDAEHRLTQRAASRSDATESVFGGASPIGQRRWNIPYLSPDESGWLKHRAILDAHLPFRDFELSRLDINGTERYLSISGDPVFDEAGAFKGYRGVGTDITARKRSEQALRESAENLRLFANNVPAMTVSFDENLRCLFASKHYADFFGFGTANIVGKHVREIIGEDAYGEVEGYFGQVLRGHAVEYQKTRRLQNGEPRYLEIKLLPHIGDQGKVLGCFAVMTDITEHILAEERIQRMAHHDSLTGLPNRLLFNDRLHQAISLAKRDSRQFALLYLDLDKFKPVNDTLGHTAGDELLQAVAARIRQQVRESDTVARVGGDEFTVILPDIARREEAETVAKKIIAAVVMPFQLGSLKQHTTIGASIGIAVYPTDGREGDALVKAADAAMYSAKQVGSSFRFYAA